MPNVSESEPLRLRDFLSLTLAIKWVCMTQRNSLPQPDAEAQALSEQLCQRLCASIERNGPLPFETFMNRALYEPGLGYYTAGATKLGAAGDFVTAPEISPLFSHCLAHQCQEVLATLPQANILEFGAGTGQMAADILHRLAQLDTLPDHYYILELSPDLQARQRNTLQAQIPDLLDRVSWLTALPPAGQFVGVMIANEVLDAMPVLRFRADGANIDTQVVTVRDGALDLAWTTLTNPVALTAINHLITAHGLAASPPYTSEWHPHVPPWISSLSDSLRQGLILLIDYGFPQAVYYHPERSEGTLVCHYRHHVHDAVLWYPGLQDITAHVDFTAVAMAAESAGLDVIGYIDQANFLMNTGILALAETQAHASTRAQITCSQQLQKLLFPHEMGELFKVMALGRSLATLPLQGFSHGDKRHTL